jgi:hypothetical protein
MPNKIVLDNEFCIYSVLMLNNEVFLRRCLIKDGIDTSVYIENRQLWAKTAGNALHTFTHLCGSR